MTTAFAAIDTIPPAGFLLIGVFALVAIAAVWIGSIILSWRGSRNRQQNGRWWSRWYGLIAIWVASTATANVIFLPLLHGFYKPFYVPAHSMMPTLNVGDRLVADIRGRKTLRRGDIVIVKVGDYDYVKRVVGLPRDTIELRGGVARVNGHEVNQKKMALLSLTNDLGHLETATVLEERFPGELTTHRILDQGYSPGDDFGPVMVPPGGLFVLGDNRDLSADSRFGPEQRGVGMARISEVRGKVMFVSWHPDKGWLGAPVR